MTGYYFTKIFLKRKTKSRSRSSMKFTQGQAKLNSQIGNKLRRLEDHDFLIHNIFPSSYSCSLSSPPSYSSSFLLLLFFFFFFSFFLMKFCKKCLILLIIILLLLLLYLLLHLFSSQNQVEILQDDQPLNPYTEIQILHDHTDLIKFLLPISENKQVSNIA